MSKRIYTLFFNHRKNIYFNIFHMFYRQSLSIFFSLKVLMDHPFKKLLVYGGGGGHTCYWLCMKVRG